MKKKILIFIIIMILIVFAIVGVLYLKNTTNNNQNNKESEIYNEDAIRFKNEYESLNGTIRESDGATYGNVEIPENNPIVYVNVEEALEVLKTGDGVLYIGSNNCPWCRINTPVMLEVAKDLNINCIYYLTLNGQSNSKDSIKELKNLLYKEIPENDEDNGKTRIYVPYYAVVKNGEIIYSKNVGIQLNANQTKYDSLTESQHQELYNIFRNIFTQ